MTHVRERMWVYVCIAYPDNFRKGNKKSSPGSRTDWGKGCLSCSTLFCPSWIFTVSATFIIRKTSHENIFTNHFTRAHRPGTLRNWVAKKLLRWKHFAAIKLLPFTRHLLPPFIPVTLSKASSQDTPETGTAPTSPSQKQRFWSLNDLDLNPGLLPRCHPVCVLWTLGRSLLGLGLLSNKIIGILSTNKYIVSSLPKRKLNSERSRNLPSDRGRGPEPRTGSLYFLAAILGLLPRHSPPPNTVLVSGP